MTKSRMVKVVWIDSGYHVAEEWKPISEIMQRFKPSNMLVTTVGLLVVEQDDIIGVGLSESEATQAVFGLQIIHRPSIQSMEYLSVQSE
jgi:hypothetical protein